MTGLLLELLWSTDKLDKHEDISMIPNF